MQTLSENRIKKAGIVYLKNYYKHRPRSSATTASLDLKTDDGIIADGRVTFLTEDHKEFVATFEATSKESQNEVLFSKNQLRLFWDVLATVFSTFAVMYFFGIGDAYLSLAAYGIVKGISMLLLLLTVCFFLLRSILIPFSRYRYIYAIEQFKAYEANDQWIVLANDVFQTPEDDYLIELKKQCVENGIGLLEVNQKDEVIALITAAREPVQLKKKRRISFVSDNKVIGNYSEKLKPGLSKVWQKIWPQKLIKTSLNRYQSANVNQVIISAVALLVIAFHVYNQYEAIGPKYIDVQKHNAELEELAKSSHLETPIYIIDSLGEVPFNAKYTPFKIIDQVNLESNPIRKVVNSKEEFLVSDENDNLIRYDCERFYNYKGDLFLVQLSLEEEVLDSEDLIYDLKNEAIDLNTVWLGCFNGNEKRYATYFGELYPDKNEAIRQAELLRRLLTQIKIKKEIVIRKISL